VTTRARIRLIVVALGLAEIAAAPIRARVAEDVISRMRAMYGELRSYSDTGRVINEFGVAATDEFTFSTCFNRAPRQFVLDFHKTADQFVIWGDPDAFHTWWKTTGEVYDYPNPNNAPALTGSARNSMSTAQKIPALLYAKAALGGDFATLSSAAIDGVEDVGGHRSHRLRQQVSDTYAATGRQTNTRQMTVWIDAESLLIRKVLEEWTPLPGQRSRITTVYEPLANPAIEAAKCRFAPKGK
jgi:hypothetical protein